MTPAPSRPPPWVLLVAVLPGLLALAAHLAGYAVAPHGMEYLGFRHEPADHAQYMAFARQAADGGGLGLANPFVADAQDGRFVLLWLWLVGFVSRAGLGLVATWHVLGLLANTAFFLLGWRVLQRVTDDARARTTGFLLLCFGGGIEPFVRVAGVDAEPVRNLYNTSSFGAAVMPLWTAAYALLLIAALAATSGRRRLPVLVAALVLAAFVHPYTAAAGGVVLGAFALIELARGRQALPLLGAVALAGVLVVGELAWALGDDVFARATQVTRQWTPHYSLVWAPVLYGVLLPLAVLGLPAAWQSTSAMARLLPVWALVSVALAVMPGIPGVKLQYLIHLPLALLAGLALAGRKRLAVLVVVIAALGPLAGLARTLAETRTAATFLPADEVALLAALDAQPPGAVLASPAVGVLVPWRAGKPVFAGHWFLTTDWPARREALALFFASETPPAAKADFLTHQHIRYVLADRTTGPPDARLGLQLLSENAFGALYAYSRAPAVAPAGR